MIRALFARSVDDLRRALEADGKGREGVFRVFERHDVQPTRGK